MTVTITSAHNTARLAATLAHLGAGSGPAKARVYADDGERPESASAAPTSTLLVEIGLTNPPGAIVDGQLLLTQAEDGLIVATCTPAWVRLVDGDGVPCLDCDVDDGENDGEVEMGGDGVLRAGGLARMVSCVLE